MSHGLLKTDMRDKESLKRSSPSLKDNFAEYELRVSENTPRNSVGHFNTPIDGSDNEDVFSEDKRSLFSLQHPSRVARLEQ